MFFGQPKPGDQLQYGRVTAAELVQAVDEMLSAVGIHMDVEKQSLLQKTLMLQEQLKESQTALVLEQVSVFRFASGLHAEPSINANLAMDGPEK